MQYATDLPDVARSQTIFFWILIARNISRHVDRNGPDAIPALEESSQPDTPRISFIGERFLGAPPSSPCPPVSRHSAYDPLPSPMGALGHPHLGSDGQDGRAELSKEQEQQILDAFRLFDTDDSGVLDAGEMRSAMLALGYLSQGPQGGRRARARRQQSAALAAAAGGGVGLEQFRELMRGSIIERTGLEEIRMTFDAIVACGRSDAGPKGASSGGGPPPAPATGTQAGSLLLSAAVSGKVEAGAGVFGDRSVGAMVGTDSLGADGDVVDGREVVGGDDGAKGVSAERAQTLHSGGGGGGGDGGGGGGGGLRILFEDLRAACQRFDVRLTDDELRLMVRESDRDCSGDVDWEEYARILKNACWF